MACMDAGSIWRCCLRAAAASVGRGAAAGGKQCPAAPSVLPRGRRHICRYEPHLEVSRALIVLVLAALEGIQCVEVENP